MGRRHIKTFYTNPYRATDKAAAERNHELIRYCLPKSHSLDGLTQDVVDDMFSHINSYVRDSKDDKTPYDLVKARFGKRFLNLINIVRIPNKKGSVKTKVEKKITLHLKLYRFDCFNE